MKFGSQSPSLSARSGASNPLLRAPSRPAPGSAPRLESFTSAAEKAQQIMNAFIQQVRAEPPEGVSRTEVEEFIRDWGNTLLDRLTHGLEAREARLKLPAEFWGKRDRTKANLRAMRLLAEKDARQLTAEDRKVLALYSGWGGLSIEQNLGQFPAEFPVPDHRALIHEYYTPSKVTSEVLRVLYDDIHDLAEHTTTLQLLEPSAGIGRFLQAFAAFPELHKLKHRWTAVELSAVSARLVAALYPDADVHNMPFESWLERGGKDARFDLILSNPPYGPRGELLTQDADKSFRVKQAYIYFMLRALPLLNKDGIGVFLVPSGFMTSSRMEKHRERLLKTHHLMTAYRLPSESEGSKDPIFPGANLVTDLIFFRARGGQLAEVLPDDQYIVEGGFFARHSHRVLGKEFNRGQDNDDHSASPRRRYAIIGDFTGLSDFEERPLQTGLMGDIITPSKKASRGGLVRDIVDEGDSNSVLGQAVSLGLRVDRYLQLLTRGELARAVAAHPELKADLLTWVEANGNPARHEGLASLLARRNPGAERFASAFRRDGTLLTLDQPPVYEPVYKGEPGVIPQADWLFRQKGELSIRALLDQLPGMTETELLDQLLPAGWCLTGPKFAWLEPETLYYTGNLWRKLDQTKDQDHPQLKRQYDRLVGLVKPAILEDLLEALSPRETWLPIEVVSEWLKAKTQSYSRLQRDSSGLVYLVRGHDDYVYSWEELQAERRGNMQELVWFIGYCNHYFALFWPPQPEEVSEDGVKRRVPLDTVRAEQHAEWSKSFQEYLRAHPEHAPAVEAAYNRKLRGFVAPTFTAEPISIERWNPAGPTLKDYQARGARRLLYNRCGMLAFDVGLGKTYTGIATLARARQEGWARRPVLLVPNSIVWKWHRDIKRCLPDYRVEVIGSSRRVAQSGARKGFMVADVDTPTERAQKWSNFQAGHYDVVLLTFSALGRTRLDPEVLGDYIEEVTAIQRQIAIQAERRREAEEGDDGKKKKKRTVTSERKLAEKEEQTAAWLSERLEANGEWEYDPGIEWHSLGIDFLMVDESQNFKNLFMPEEREGGIPDAMGGTEDSKRAWQLDFRCASVRKHTGGSGVFLLSATPAKNGPVEFYTAIHYINPLAWVNAGITNPEAFIDRFCLFEMRKAQASNGNIKERSTCVAFKNLHDLRDIIFRYCEFRTAEEVGLVIPGASNREHFVELNDLQFDAIQECFQEIEDLMDKMKKLHGENMEGARAAQRMKIQGLAMKVDLIAVHPRLPGSSQLHRKAIEAIDPHSGKIDACVETIIATADTACDPDKPDWCLNCGHIVFVENIAVHYWVRLALMEAGIPEKRIAILNANDVKDPERRQQIAEAFNGIGSPGDEVYTPPAYDVVIANAVAYEGVDLQRRTCAIHHLDLPWEPATLQQRNGRGVRQGNKFETVKIHYYFARNSGDGRRLSKIDGKRSWMTSLVKGQDRVTNNPSARVDSSVMDMLLDIMPASARRAFEETARAEAIEREKARRVKIVEQSVQLLNRANARFRKAESSDPAEAKLSREEGEKILAEAMKVDPEIWPWGAFAQRLRYERAWIMASGMPLFAGDIVPVSLNINGMVGNPTPEGPTFRLLNTPGSTSYNTARFRMSTEAQLPWLQTLRPENVNPSDVVDVTTSQLVTEVKNGLRSSDWSELQLHHAPTTWLDGHWPELAPELNALLRRRAWNRLTLPVEVRGTLLLIVTNGYGAAPAPGEQLLAPTETGWQRFLALAPASGYKFSELEAAGKGWWARNIPRDLLAKARKESE